MAEIVRAGIISVDEGQVEAAQSVGMRRLQTLRLVVLPQAMRLIIPPTGNEIISMLKTSSLASVITVTELLGSVVQIYAANYETIPLLMVASIWYLAVTSVLTVGQYFIERRYSRGAARPRSLDLAQDGPEPALSPSSAGTPSRPWRSRDRSRSTGDPTWCGPRAFASRLVGCEALRGIDLTVRDRRGAVPHRTVRVGQEHVPTLHQPPREDRRRQPLRGRRAGRIPPAGRQALRVG